MPKCEKCGKVFDSEHALKIHVGRLHKQKPKSPATAKAAAQDSSTQDKSLICPDCGRAFGKAMHLARHRSAAHPTKKRGRPARKDKVSPTPSPAIGPEVGSLTIEQLLSLKTQVDSRLVQITDLLKKSGL